MTTNEVTVPMDVAWTPTGISCEEGDTIHITARGVGSTRMPGTPSGRTASPVATGCDQRVEDDDIQTYALIGRLENQTDAFSTSTPRGLPVPRTGRDVPRPE